MKNSINIKVLNNISNDKLPWADYRSELKTKKFKSIDELKDWFYVSAIGKVSLKFVDTKTKKPMSYEENIDTELFCQFQTDWLGLVEAGKNKYLELTSFDYRIANKAA